MSVMMLRSRILALLIVTVAGLSACTPDEDVSVENPCEREFFVSLTSFATTSEHTTWAIAAAEARTKVGSVVPAGDRQAQQFVLEVDEAGYERRFSYDEAEKEGGLFVLPDSLCDEINPTPRLLVLIEKSEFLRGWQTQIDSPEPGPGDPIPVEVRICNDTRDCEVFTYDTPPQRQR